MLLAAGIGVAVPLIFLYLIYTLDLYASGSFYVIISCFLWGIGSFFVAYQLNTAALGWVSWATLTIWVAPIIEELLKSLILVYHVRRTYFTYFVDGAIYGFAAGTGFAILETLFYLMTYGGGLGLSLMRSFSTSLMHGSTSALVGVTLGRVRFERGSTRLIGLPIGWGLAILLHVAFNRTLTQSGGFGVQIQAVSIGLAGVVATTIFIIWGLREERTWLRETLGLPVGVSAGESAVVQELSQLAGLLAPIGERFGHEKQMQVERFLRLQARLGLKRKAQALARNSTLREDYAAEVVSLRTEIDRLRREVGIYCMAYVRSILPPASDSLWTQLEATLSDDQLSDMNLWGTLAERVES